MRKTTSINLPYEVKKIISVERFPDDKNYLEFIKQVANYYQVPPLVLIKRFRRFIEQKNITESENNTSKSSVQTAILSDDQMKAFNKIAPHIEQQNYNVTIARRNWIWQNRGL